MSDAKTDAKVIFLEALDCKGVDEVRRFLDQACGTDPALRARVEELLRAHQDAGAFLGRAEQQEATRDQPFVERPGTIIGPYKLLEQIGEGGFGLVFMAEQQQPVRRKVAVKVLKPGMDTRQVIARFEAERQALALMDHSNIARVLDAGETSSGRPHFVMELVKGVPITEYCDQNRLTTRERLALFTHVCHAVQHAHHKGIIHRDLKPSNVMVTLHDGAPVVKVIDFGIAKALGQQLTDKTLFTGFAQMVGTPMYMSPEQAQLSGLDIDTRSDIYSLGVLLYELLAGVTPFDGERMRTAGYDEMRRIIREEDPPSPSTRLSTLGQAAATVSAERKSDPKRLCRLLRGELDWIVMKAIEKDRNRRYETANELARDVDRYLHDEPVRACPPTRLYRACKFVRRHKAAVLITSATCLAPLVGMAILAASNVAIGQEQERTSNALAAETRAKIGLGESLKRERLDSYFQRIARAEREWSINNLTRAEQLLEECPADLRGWEWHYLRRLRLGNLTRLRHNGPAISVAISPDGRWLASGDTRGIVKLWDTITWKEVHSLDAHAGQVNGLSFSPDGRRLASASLDKTVRVWDIGTWKQLTTFREHGEVDCLAFSPDGHRLAWAGADNTVRIWNATDGGRVVDLTGHLDAIFRLSFSPDGGRLATASLDRTVKVWDVARCREQLTFRGHKRMVLGLAFSPDGRQIASADGTLWKSDDGVVKLWDAATGEERLALRGHLGEISAVAFSPDGRRLASGGADQTLRLWDVLTGREALIMRGHSDMIWNLTFSSDGRRLASTSMDHTVTVWDAYPLEQKTGRELLSLTAQSGAVFRGVVFSPDGRRLASAGTDNTVRIWEAGTWKEILVLSGHTDDVASVAMSADSRHIASSSGRELIIWDAETGERQVSVPGSFRSTAYSPDGKSIASALEFEVRIKDARTGREIRALHGHESFVLDVAFSPDGQSLASASSDMTVKIWDAETGRSKRTLSGHSGRVCALAFSPDGDRLATASLDRTIKVWDLPTGTEMLTLRDPTGGVLGVTYSPDGKRLAWANMDGTLKVWDGTAGSEFLTLRGHTRWVFGVKFSPDGRLLASASADGTVKIWDATRWDEKLNP
jgi:eukaryotic-like serine/threonine-protein kinase